MSNTHRVFIAVNLPFHLKTKLKTIQESWKGLEARLTKEDNIHITLVFIGYVNTEQMAEVCKLARKVVEKHEPFELNFNQIILAPPAKTPRMLWLIGEKCDNLSQIKNELEDVFINNNTGLRYVENRPFSPHITLARFSHKYSAGEGLEQTLAMNFSVNSVEVMESHLSRLGPKYDVLESISLNSY